MYFFDLIDLTLLFREKRPHSDDPGIVRDVHLSTLLAPLHVALPIRYVTQTTMLRSVHTRRGWRLAVAVRVRVGLDLSLPSAASSEKITPSRHFASLCEYPTACRQTQKRDA